MIQSILNQLTVFLGGAGTTFLATFLFLSMFSIGLHFLFNLFRLHTPSFHIKTKK